MLLRRLWDRWDLGAWLDERTEEVPGRYRPSLMVELWTVLLLYGGGWMDDLKLLAARGVRRLFGWEAVPDPTIFGRWLRRAGSSLVPLLDELLWQLVQARWREDGVPEQVTLALDSTVCVRYGEKQAGAERGYNPRKPGRPSHHPCWPSWWGRATVWGCAGGRARRGRGAKPPRSCPSWSAGSGRRVWRRSRSGSTRASSRRTSSGVSRSSRSPT